MPLVFGSVVSFLIFLRCLFVLPGVIDAWSSKPPVKEDDVEHEKRCASAEKHKFVQDVVRKKEKRKNLERQALEER